MTQLPHYLHRHRPMRQHEMGFNKDKRRKVNCRRKLRSVLAEDRYRFNLAYLCLTFIASVCCVCIACAWLWASAKQRQWPLGHVCHSRLRGIQQLFITRDGKGRTGRLHTQNIVFLLSVLLKIILSSALSITGEIEAAGEYFLYISNWNVKDCGFYMGLRDGRS